MINVRKWHWYNMIASSTIYIEILPLFTYLFVFTFKDLLYFMCFPCICVCVCCVHSWSPRRSDKGIRFPGTEVTDICEWPYGCWELNWVLCESNTCFYCWAISVAQYLLFSVCVWHICICGGRGSVFLSHFPCYFLRVSHWTWMELTSFNETGCPAGLQDCRSLHTKGRVINLMDDGGPDVRKIVYLGWDGRLSR